MRAAILCACGLIAATLAVGQVYRAPAGAPQPVTPTASANTAMQAQESAANMQTIEVQGLATVESPPSHADFVCTFQIAGATVSEAASKATAIEPAVREQIQTLELSPTEVTFSGMSVPSVEKKTAVVSCRLRFGLGALVDSPEASQQFAAICDKVAALAGAFSATVEGPALGADDPQASEDAAIARATENAYATRGRAAAQILNAQITSVEKVSVEMVAWNTAEANMPTLPTLKRIACTARVRVTYSFAR